MTPESRTATSPGELDDLEQEITRLRRLDEAKSRFLATVSHELRTPLTAILTYAEALDEDVLGDLSDAQRDAVESIASATQQLLGMVDEILQFSRSAARGGELHPESFPVEEMLERVQGAHESLIRKKELRLEARVEDGLPRLFADRAKAIHVLSNLLANAIDFTPSGGSIEIRATATPDREWLRLEVADTGPGIAPEEQEKIFGQFVRADDGRDRQLGGTGLGLAIASQFVELHGGEIDVESEVGQGSCFHVTLPTEYNEHFVAARREEAAPTAD